MPRVAKRKQISSSLSRGLGGAKRQRISSSDQQWASDVQLRRPKHPVGEPWPVNDLWAFHPPLDLTQPINHGPMTRDVLKERGWRYSCNPCHGAYDEETDTITFHVKEFEASIRGEKPEKIFGKKGVIEDGYKLKALPLPKHAMWTGGLGRLHYRVPGKDMNRMRFREDFVKTLVEYGDHLPGKSGNYRISKFPGMETLLFKANLTKAFKNKPWYPTTYVLPGEKARLIKDLKQRGNSRDNMWIGKPNNDYGGNGIRVWKGTDPDLFKTIKLSDNSPRSLIQQYLADPHLVAGYKYHMRIHLVITNLCPLQAFVQENGQALFATKPYNLSSKSLGTAFDPPVHVTNMCLNASPENKENYFRSKPVVGPGQQIRMRQLMDYLAETEPSFTKSALWQQIVGIAADFSRYVAKGVQRQCKVAHDRHYEIFGMDLMLDKNLKVWMCEVNTDPGLGYPDKDVLGCPNPDRHAEHVACKETLHDVFTLLGLDAKNKPKQGSLRHWYEVDFDCEFGDSKAAPDGA